MPPHNQPSNDDMEMSEKLEKSVKDVPDDIKHSVREPSEEAPIIPYNVKSGNPLPIVHIFTLFPNEALSS